MLSDFDPQLPHYVRFGDEPAFPDHLEPDESGLIAVGGSLSEDVLVEAYDGEQLVVKNLNLGIARVECCSTRRVWEG